MEEYEIENKYNDEGGETIYNHREYNIKDENNNYILRIEINEKYITFIISLDNNNEYNYKTQMTLSAIVDKLELNKLKYNNLELILKLLDEIYENKKILINISNDESCTLIIKFINVLKEVTYELKLYKNYTNLNDKFKMIFNQIRQLKNNNNNYDNDKVEELNSKIIELNNKIEQKDKEIKDIINKKDIIINDMNQKLLNQENKIKELESKHIDLRNNNENNQNEIINRHENEIKKINEKIPSLENDVNNKFSKIIFFLL